MDEFGNALGGGGYSFDPDSGYVSGGGDAVNQPSGFSPDVASPGSSSFTDVLLRGFSRGVDAITEPTVLTNTQPVQKPATPIRQNTGASPSITSKPLNIAGFSISAGALIALLV